MAARITKDGLWRVTYGEQSGLTAEELIARQPEKFRRMLPGHPGPDQPIDACFAEGFEPTRGAAQRRDKTEGAAAGTMAPVAVNSRHVVEMFIESEKLR